MVATVNKETIQATLLEICDFITKGATPTTYGFDWQPTGIVFLRNECVSEHGLDLHHARYISDAANSSLRRSRVKDGDILMAITRAVGRVVRVSGVGAANINQHIARIRVNDPRFDPGYVYHFLSQRSMRKHYENIMTGQVYPQISLAQVRNTSVFAPSVTQQRRISESLDCADSLIAELRQMIIKKEAVKQGLMQQLLTGKTRLPGFTQPWDLVHLGSHVSYVRNVALSRAQLDSTSTLRYLHYGDIHTRQGVTLNATSEPMPRVPASIAGRTKRLRPGDLVFADASEDPTGVGKSVEITDVPDGGVIPGLHTIAARFDKDVLADGFKAYLQFIPTFRNSLLRLVSGTKVLATTRAYISSIELALPSVDEQRAIAKILTDCEVETAALLARLKKAEEVKKGMMQELLTGKTWLV